MPWNLGTGAKNRGLGDPASTLVIVTGPGGNLAAGIGIGMRAWIRGLVEAKKCQHGASANRNFNSRRQRHKGRAGARSFYKVYVLE